MQLHTTADGQEDTTADGQEDETSMVSCPTWSASTSQGQRALLSTANKHIHWWPAQAYHCTFCPRVFRTAQALGGHMNIHRRQRAFGDDTGTHFQTRQGDSQASNSTLSRSSSHPAATLDQVRSSQSGSTPPAARPRPRHVRCVAHYHANRRTAVTPNSPTHQVTTSNFSAPIQPADRTDQRVGRNGSDAARLQESSGHNASDPLSWLFSQLPPPGTVSTQQTQQSQPQPQQNQQHQQQWRGGNIMANPYHRVVAVRRSGGHPPPPLPEQTWRARGEWETGGSGHGELDEELDLELRL